MKIVYYYIDSDGSTKGPVGIDHFKNNHTNPHSWVWHQGLPQWVEAHTIPPIRKYMRNNLPVSFSTKKGIIDYEKERVITPESRVVPETELSILRNRVPKTWLAESILITIFCCVPFGVVAIIYASKVSAYWRRGLYGESIYASNSAAFWVRLTIVLTIALWVLYTILWIFTPMAERSVMWWNNYFTNPM